VTGRLRRVVVAGGGVAAAMAAVALARRLPWIEVSWIDTGRTQDAVEDLAGAARPSLGAYHRAIGLDERDILHRTTSGVRFGTMIEGWSAKAVLRTHCPLPQGSAGVPIHHLWLRLYDDAEVPAWSAIIRGGCVDGTPALQLDLNGYRGALRALSARAGVVRIEATLANITRSADGAVIERVRLSNGLDLTADLYVDATGGQRSLTGRPEAGWIDWSASLPTRQLVWERRSSATAPTPFDRLVARPGGWQMEMSLAGAMIWLTGLAQDAPLETAQGPQPDETCTLALEQGRLAEPFSGNMVAIGSAAVALEPIGATALHLVCQQIERLIGLWPGGGLNPVEIGLYNRRAAMEADRLRDFVQLHYLGVDRCSAGLSAALAEDIELFAERGRLVPRDEDGIEADEWVGLLLGLGIRPRRRDALASAISLADARQRIAAAVKTGQRFPMENVR
jgi:tryptophan halogenase